MVSAAAGVGGAGAGAASMEKGSISEGQSVGLIYDRKVSSIGPADVTGSDVIWEPHSLDLAMKLHYLRGVYYFGKEAFEGLTTLVIKEPMFMWLNKYPMTCGRFRRRSGSGGTGGTGTNTGMGSGRPFIKCNDCGVRFLEAKSHKTLDEWMEMKKNENNDCMDIEKLLVPSQVIGPELGFSPLVFIQLTKFKCGGTAVGISWAHVLGDAFAVAEFMNSLGKVEAGLDLGRPMNLTQTHTKITADEPIMTPVENKESDDDPLSINRVAPVGDNWIHDTELQLEVFSFTLTATRLGHLQAKLGPNGSSLTPFAAVSAIIWQCIARIRGEGNEPNVVTICTKNNRLEDASYSGLGNKQKVSIVRAEFTIAEANPSKLASMVKDDAIEENEKIDETMTRGQGLADVIIFGANLTFVDLEGAKFYEFEYRGQKPIDVNCRIDGVGEKGTILVLPPNPKDGGRNVMAILPQTEIFELKSELQREGLIA